MTLTRPASFTSVTPLTFITLLTLAGGMSGCETTRAPWLPTSGPSTATTVAVGPSTSNAPALRLVDIAAPVVQRIQAAQSKTLFAQAFTATAEGPLLLGPGDVLEATVWEAPPAQLFAAPAARAVDARTPVSGAAPTVIADLMIRPDGHITLPFAGDIRAAGRTPQDIEADARQLWRQKANAPQVSVRVTRNVTRNVTVVGEVAQSVRLPLSAKRERVLDALAAAGGSRQPVGKSTVRLARAGQVASMSMETLVSDPRHNIVLQPDDVITVVHQPYSLTALGATGHNAEVVFEAEGISLSQALARAGGLQDARADARGVFVFRYEDSKAVEGAVSGAGAATAPVPVVYRLDLSQPESFLLAQNFPMRHKDVMYVSNAPAAELQKFLNIVGSALIPLATLRNSLP